MTLLILQFFRLGQVSLSQDWLVTLGQVGYVRLSQVSLGCLGLVGQVRLVGQVWSRQVRLGQVRSVWLGQDTLVTKKFDCKYATKCCLDIEQENYFHILVTP